jgi:hypothetical protein
MPFSDDQLQKLTSCCEKFRDSEPFDGYPHSLALCIIDSVQSTGVRYSSVENVVTRYRAYRAEQGGDANTDSADALLQTFAELGSPEDWAARIGNGNRTSTQPGAPLKAVAIRDEAAAMIGVGIRTTQDLRDAAANPERLAHIAKAWRGVVAQDSGVTWHYVQMLADISGIKPDRMIIRFVADCLGVPTGKVASAFCVEILTEVARALNISATALDHAIWNWQRGT